MQFLDFNPKTSDYKMAQQTVHFLYHMVQTVQGSKYGTVPSNTVQLAGLPFSAPPPPLFFSYE